MEFTVPGDAGPAIVTFGVGEGTIVTPQAAALNVITAWNNASSLQGRMASTTILTSVYALWNDGGVFKSHDEPTNIAGAVATGSQESPQVAVLIRKNTGFAGRSQRGRNYWPGIREADVEISGNLVVGTRTAWQDAATFFLAQFSGGGLAVTDMVLLHDSGSPTSGATLVTSYTVDSKVATQRRRLR
jgi:hypothetical protein